MDNREIDWFWVTAAVVVFLCLVAWSVNYFVSRREAREAEEERERLRVLDRQADKTAALLTEAVDKFERLISRVRYIDNRQVTDWETRYGNVEDKCIEAKTVTNKYPELVDRYVSYSQNSREKVTEANNDFVDQEIQNYSKLFDTIEADALTKAQAKAVVHDEENHLVMAGAGSGKTSLIVAKAAYLLQKGIAEPENILILAYNKDAAGELKERISRRFKKLKIRAMSKNGVMTVSTFHSYGMAVAKHAIGSKPSVSRIVDERYSEKTVKDVINQAVTDLFKHKIYGDMLKAFFVTDLIPIPDLEDVSELQYKQEVKGLPPTFKEVESTKGGATIKGGEPIKSHGELTIANWLHINGYYYEYEPEYEHKVSTLEKRQYKPDFCVKRDDGSVVYIEYFGTDRNGKTCPTINKYEYQKTIEWKRATHERYGTSMVETFYYQLKEKTLVEHLKNELERLSVTPTIANPAENENLEKYTSEFTNLTVTFLNLFKSNLWNFADIHAAAGKHLDARRCKAFVKLFEPIYEIYEKAIRGEHGTTIDFSDMIKLSTEHLCNHEVKQPFTHVIVDECQDSSKGRAGMLKALKNVYGVKLTCVGDDWQSIYRFSGSDISYMTKFKDFFGYAAESRLDRTFRFTQPLVDASSHFITRNPDQLTKEISAAESTQKPIEIIKHPRNFDSETVNEALQKISRETKNRSCDVLILSRYNKPLKDLKIEAPDHLKIRSSTIHKAKGGQADYTIVIGMKKGFYGFPSEISDDPILDLVLTDPEEYPCAEERRIFYVALTRTKQKVFLLTENMKPSSFIDELLARPYANWVHLIHLCNACKSGIIEKKWNRKNKIVYKCSNIASCLNQPRKCGKCSNGQITSSAGNRWRCNNKNCQFVTHKCKRCKKALMAYRENKKTKKQFLGCEHYYGPRAPQNCSYTENI